MSVYLLKSSIYPFITYIRAVNLCSQWTGAGVTLSWKGDRESLWEGGGEERRRGNSIKGSALLAQRTVALLLPPHPGHLEPGPWQQGCLV